MTGRRRFRPYDVGRTCKRCGGLLVSVRGAPRYVRCKRCGKGEVRLDLEPEVEPPGDRPPDPRAA